MPIASGDTTTLFLAGDVMTGRGVDQVLPAPSEPQLYEHYIRHADRYVELAEQHSGAIDYPVTFEYIWGDALAVLKQKSPRFKLINLETAITTSSEHWPGKGIHYRMHPGNINLLTIAGVDASILANNHSMDWVYAGLRETVKTLSDSGITVNGAGNNLQEASNPVIFETNTGRLLLFSYTTPDAGTPLNWSAKKHRPGVNLLKTLLRRDQHKVIETIDNHRKPGDRVILSLHWGDNWGYDNPDTHRYFARRMIDAGCADIIFGHSSHHPRGIEVYKDRLILYSCGDLINDYEGIPGHREYRGDLSLMYFPEVDHTGKLVSLTMIPMQIRRFSLRKPTDEDHLWLFDRMNEVLRMFDTSITRTTSGDFRLNW